MEALKPFLLKGPCNIIVEYVSIGTLESKKIQAIVHEAFHSQETKSTAIAPERSVAMASIAGHKAPLDEKKPSVGQDEKVPARPGSPKQ